PEHAEQLRCLDRHPDAPSLTGARTARRVTANGPDTRTWHASRALGSLAFIPLPSVARSAACISEQCSEPSSTTTQQVPHSQSPPHTVGQNHPWRCAAAMSDSA